MVALEPDLRETRRYRDVIPACELEPIGPRNEIAPGESASFTEDWWLLPYLFPKNPEQLNLRSLEFIVKSQMNAVPAQK